MKYLNLQEVSRHKDKDKPKKKESKKSQYSYDGNDLPTITKTQQTMSALFLILKDGWGKFRLFE